jgi:hypothetical protein
VTTTLTPGSTSCRPRFATPRDESFPTHGPAVAAIAEKLGRPLMPWQRDLVDVAYEFDPQSGRFRYDEVDTTVPRQSGKTTVTLAKKVYRLTKLARELGPQRSTYTAQSRLKARQKLERDFSELLRASRFFREVPHARARPQRATEWRQSLNNGSEHIQFGSGSFLQIDAPSRTGGHGDTLDDGTIDEAFAHVDSTIEDGMRPSMATRRNAQLWVISTAGDVRSKYLWRKVLAGRAAAESGAHGNVCYVEYSAPEDADPGDPATWWGCMPALGITIDVSFIQGEWDRAQRRAREGIDGFRRAYLNQWPEIPVLDEDGPAVYRLVSLAAWNAAAQDVRPDGRPVFFVTMAKQMASASVAVAALHEGMPHVELADHRPGTAWVADRIIDLHEKYPSAQFAANAAGPAKAWVPILAESGIELKLLTSPESAAAYAHVAKLAETFSFTHSPDELAADSVAGCEWKEAEGGGTTLDWRKSAGDVSPFAAEAGALWLLESQPAQAFFASRR